MTRCKCSISAAFLHSSGRQSKMLLQSTEVSSSGQSMPKTEKQIETHDCRISPPPLPFPPQKHTWSGLRRRARQQMTSCTGAGLRSNICSIQNAPATSQSLMKHKSHRGIGESRYLSVFVPSYHFLALTHRQAIKHTHTPHHSHTCTSYETWQMA